MHILRVTPGLISLITWSSLISCGLVLVGCWVCIAVVWILLGYSILNVIFHLCSPHMYSTCTKSKVYNNTVIYFAFAVGPSLDLPIEESPLYIT